MPSPAGSVYLARAIRDFGDGFIAILLPVYLTALGLSAFEVGLVATLALLGSAILTLGIGLLGGGPMLVRRLVPQPPADARGGATRAAGP